MLEVLARHSLPLIEDSSSSSARITPTSPTPQETPNPAAQSPRSPTNLLSSHQLRSRVAVTIAGAPDCWQEREEGAARPHHRNGCFGLPITCPSCQLISRPPLPYPPDLGFLEPSAVAADWEFAGLAKQLICSHPFALKLLFEMPVWRNAGLGPRSTTSTISSTIIRRATPRWSSLSPTTSSMT